MNMLHPAERDNTHFSMQETVEMQLPGWSCLGKHALRTMEVQRRLTAEGIMATQ